MCMTAADVCSRHSCAQCLKRNALCSCNTMPCTNAVQMRFLAWPHRTSVQGKKVYGGLQTSEAIARSVAV